MNAIANVATNVEQAPRFAGSITYAFGTPRTSRARRAPRINRQTIYAVRKVTVTYHCNTRRDAHYVILA